MQNPLSNHIQNLIKDNLPSILSGAAVVGLVGTVVLAVKATPESMTDLAQAKEDKVEEAYREMSETDRATAVRNYGEQTLTVFETIKAGWKPYIPAILCGTATVACIISANTIGLKRYAALGAAYTLVDGNFREYRDKVIEHVTPQKAQKIDDEIAEAQVQKNLQTGSQVIITGLGEQLCYDSLTGRTFKSDIEHIRRAANEVNARILKDMYASLNEFHDLLGLDATTLGNELGFNLDHMLEIVFTSHLTSEQVPVLAIGYTKLPVKNYDHCL